MEFTERYPTLFALVDNRAATGVFEVLDVAPPFDLVGNVYMVPCVGDEYLYILQGDGRPQIPGGRMEAGEMPRQALARELLEEAGANPIEAEVFGGWHLMLKTDGPDAPHLPYPETWALVYSGVVERVSRPTNPDGSRPTTEVHVAPLKEVVNVFRDAGREDLAELYWLVDEQRRGLV
ncbi:MAG: NUDIX domain-containing protein [Planctomycetota bacterium]|nr:NUDIX domain-containing protein [Planctomycetota bacterium]